MGWSAQLYGTFDGHEIALHNSGWDYTWNTQHMILDVVQKYVEQYLNPDSRHSTPEWFATLFERKKTNDWTRLLNGETGAQGCLILGMILDDLKKDPERFIAMNPPNGWGSYDSLLDTLESMYTCSQEYPSGIWKIG